MNDAYNAPSYGAANQSMAQLQQSQAPKQIGLNATIQSLVSEAQESANLAENLASSFGLSLPKDSGTSGAPPNTPTDVVRMAASMLRSANMKLTDVLQHINS